MTPTNLAGTPPSPPSQQRAGRGGVRLASRSLAVICWSRRRMTAREADLGRRLLVRAQCPPGGGREHAWPRHLRQHDLPARKAGATTTEMAEPPMVAAALRAVTATTHATHAVPN